jgi:hypothetical protein
MTCGGVGDRLQTGTAQIGKDPPLEELVFGFRKDIR